MEKQHFLLWRCIFIKRRLLMLLCVSFLLTACDGQLSTIEDDSLYEYVEEMSIVPVNMVLVENISDEMDQGRFEYSSLEWGKFIVDPMHTKYTRGDVVYIDTPVFDSKAVNPNMNPPKSKILRIVGLPDERIKVENGKVYINDSLLETFYGSARKSGMNEDEYLEFANKRKMEPANINFDINYSEFLIPANSYFLIGDNWWRSVDSFIFGEVPEKNILGKVVGYLKNNEPR